MAEFSGFFADVNGDRTYDESFLARFTAAIVGNGVYNGELSVTAGDHMQVIIAIGRAWISGHHYYNDAALPKTVDNADGALGRKDAVVLRFDVNTRNITSMVLRGTPASNPVAPAIVRTAEQWDLKIAEVSVPAGTTAITQAMITDTRLNSSVCGIVTGAVTQLDTTTLGQQLNNYISNYQQQADVKYNAFVAQVATEGSNVDNIVASASAANLSKLAAADSASQAATSAQAAARWTTPTIVAAGVDWNTLQTSGNYIVPAANPNSPTAVFSDDGYGINTFALTVAASSSAYVTQTAYTVEYANASADKDRHRVFTRRWFATSGWSVWREIMTNDASYRKDEVDLKFADKLNAQITILNSGTDLNSVTALGFYRIMAVDALHAPSVDTSHFIFWLVEVVSSSAFYVVQKIYPVGFNSDFDDTNKPTGYIRRYNLTQGWTPWRKMLTEDDAYLKNAVDAALSLKMDASQKGAVSGVAGLDASGSVPASELANLMTQPLTNQSSVWQVGQGANGVAAVKNGSPVNVSSLKGQTIGGNSVTNPVLTATGKNLLHDATFTAAAGHAGCCSAKGMLLPNTTYTLSVVLPVGEQFYANEQLFTGSPFTPVGDGVTRQYVTVTTQSSISTSNSNQYNSTYGWGLFKNAAASTPVSGNASALQVEYGRNSTAYEPYKSSQLTISGTYRSNGTSSDEVNLVGTRWMFTQRIGTDGSALATPATTDITAQVTGGLTAYSGGHILVSTDTGIYPSVDMQYVADAAQFAGTWVPTLTWTTGIPTITQSTFSYVLRGKMCRICAYMGMSNGAGATNLTMTLPFAAKSFGGIKPTPLATQIQVGGTWSNGMAYVDDANNLIKFRAAVTLTNGSPAAVSICGEYEVA